MKKVVIASGDPAGCGPYITLKAIDQFAENKCHFIVVGDLKIFQTFSLYRRVKHKFDLIDIQTQKIETIKKGKISTLSGKASLAYLDKALDIIKTLHIPRLVTAPVSKEAIQFVLPRFCGHTEYLAQYFNCKDVGMMMIADQMKTILATRHILLREVPEAITQKSLKTTFDLACETLQSMFKIKNPCIGVAAVNPHAGINTFLDKEEKIIVQAIKLCKKGKIQGPFPADTLFTPTALRRYDCIVTMYHDQAMIPFKLLAIKHGVNLTVGLPIIRTSPAHGTAADLMQRGKKPFASSMIAAIKLALQLQGPVGGRPGLYRTR